MSEAKERQEPRRRGLYEFTDEEIERFFDAKWRLETCEVWANLLPGYT